MVLPPKPCDRPSSLATYFDSPTPPTLSLQDERRSTKLLANTPSLLDLPREIRDLIYYEIYDPKDTEFISLVLHKLDPAEWAKRCSPAVGVSTQPGVSLHRTCWQIYQEALPVLYKYHEFYLNPRNNEHCDSCFQRDDWPCTLGSLAARRPPNTQFMTAVSLWANLSPGSYRSSQLNATLYHKKFWPYAYSLSGELSKFFPRLKQARFMPHTDEDKIHLFACMKELEHIEVERRCVTYCESCMPKYEHSITFDTSRSTRHPALVACYRMLELIGTAMLQAGIPNVLVIHEHLWTEGKNQVQRKYREHVMNIFLDIIKQQRITSTNQLDPLLEAAAERFEMRIPCGKGAASREEGAVCALCDDVESEEKNWWYRGLEEDQG